MVLPYMTVLFSIQLIHSAQNVAATQSNVALGKPTRQINDYLDMTSSLAVDGELKLVRPHCAHTRGNRNAWWYVDLQAEYDIGWIRIYNRVDCCSERLSNFTISVGNDYSGDLKYTLCYYHDGEYGLTPLFLPCNATQPARYVKIQLTQDKGWLTLCEVEIYTSDYIFNYTSPIGDTTILSTPGRTETTAVASTGLTGSVGDTSTPGRTETTAVASTGLTGSVGETSETSLVSQSIHGLTTSFLTEATPFVTPMSTIQYIFSSSSTYQLTVTASTTPIQSIYSPSTSSSPITVTTSTTPIQSIYSLSTSSSTNVMSVTAASLISQSIYSRQTLPLTEVTVSATLYDSSNSYSDGSDTSPTPGHSAAGVDLSDSTDVVSMADMAFISLSDSFMTSKDHAEPSSDISITSWMSTGMIGLEVPVVSSDYVNIQVSTQRNSQTSETPELIHVSIESDFLFFSDFETTTMLETSFVPLASDAVLTSQSPDHTNAVLTNQSPDHSNAVLTSQSPGHTSHVGISKQPQWSSETFLIQPTEVVILRATDVTTGVYPHGSQTSVTSVTSEVRSRRLLCTSMCRDCVPVDYSMAEDEARRLRARLLLDRKNLSMYIRAKTSAENKVRSSVYIGWSGMVIVCVIAAVVLIPDLAAVVRAVVQMSNKPGRN